MALFLDLMRHHLEDSLDVALIKEGNATLIVHNSKTKELLIFKIFPHPTDLGQHYLHHKKSFKGLKFRDDDERFQNGIKYLFYIHNLDCFYNQISNVIKHLVCPHPVVAVVAGRAKWESFCKFCPVSYNEIPQNGVMSYCLSSIYQSKSKALCTWWSSRRPRRCRLPMRSRTWSPARG